MTEDATERANGIIATYRETSDERVLAFETNTGPSTVVVAQNLEGYAVLKVRSSPDGGELERYYGFDMALDHVAEELSVSPAVLPVPDAAADMGI